MRPQISVGFGERYFQAQEFGQSYVLPSCWSVGGAGTHFNGTRGGEFVVDSEASMDMMSKKELSSEEMGTVK